MKFKLPRLVPESQELLHLDALRVFSAYCVVLCHYRVLFSVPLSFGWLIDRLINLNLFVDVFFVVSGIVISHIYVASMRGPSDYGRFLKRRIARLLPLHWATLLFYVFVGLFAAKFGMQASVDRDSWSCFPANMLLFHSFGVCRHLTFNDPSWSISAEFALYIMFPAFAILARRYRLAILLSAAVLLIFLFGFDLCVATDRTWHERTFDGGVLRAAPAFMIGVTAYAYRGHLRRIPFPALISLSFLAACVGGIVVGLPKGFLLILAYFIPISAYAADLRGRPGPIVRWSAPAGQLTYSIYMLHAAIGVVLIKVAAVHVLHMAGGVLNIAVLGVMLCTMPLAYISLFFFERPARSWLSRLKKEDATSVRAQMANVASGIKR